MNTYVYTMTIISTAMQNLYQQRYVCSAQFFILLLPLLILCNACSFEPLENSVTAGQLGTPKDTSSGQTGKGSISCTLNGKAFSAKGMYDATAKKLSAKIDENNYIEFTFAPSSAGAAIGNNIITPVAIVPGTVSVAFKRLNNDGTGFICNGAGASGNFSISSVQNNLIVGNFSCTASAAVVGTGAIISVSVQNGVITEVPF